MLKIVEYPKIKFKAILREINGEWFEVAHCLVDVWYPTMRYADLRSINQSREVTDEEGELYMVAFENDYIPPTRP